MEISNQQRNIVVIGGGPAGIEASRALDAMGYTVFLVERDSRLGGHLCRWDRLFPYGTPAEDVLSQLTASMGRIKWFTSTEVQASYGRTVESLLGALGRFDPANINAISELAWSRSDQEKILEQFNSLKENPVIPATYIVGRNMTNAFRMTVNNGENPRETLLWYNDAINDEIIRKYEDLGIDVDDLINK